MQLRGRKGYSPTDTPDGATRTDSSRYELIFESTPDAVFVSDAETGVAAFEVCLQRAADGTP